MASPQPAEGKQGFLKMRPMTGRERALFLVLFVVLYGVGFYFWVYQPFTVRIEGLQKTLEEKQAKLDAAIAIFHRLDEINARIAELEQQMTSLDLLVPGDNRAAHFLYSCWQWERKTGARVRDMTFNSPAATGSYEEYTVHFTVVGTYGAQVGFLASLEGMDRLVRVDSVTFIPEDVTAPSATGETGGTGDGSAGDGSGGATTPSAPALATTDMTTAQYVVHLFVDPSKAEQAAQEEPGAGLVFTVDEGRKTPFLP